MQIELAFGNVGFCRFDANWMADFFQVTYSPYSLL